MADKYDNPTKDTWRGWAWNQIASRVPPGSLVMVLCGDTDMDNRHAMRRGLRCVGIDIRQDGVDVFRAGGGIAVKDKIHRQLWLLKPQGVILDMLGGITVPSFVDPVMASWISCQAIVWNGLRGRDTLGGKLSRESKSLTVLQYKDRVSQRGIAGVHRGKLGIVLMSGLANAILYGDKSEGLNHFPHRHPTQGFLDDFCRMTKPEFSSYRSKDSGQHFDSFAMTTCVKTQQVQMHDTKVVRESKRKAAAAKALLTMRLNSN